MQKVFDLRNEIIAEYERYSRSFTFIRADDIRNTVDEQYRNGRYWPKPSIQINPNYVKAKERDPRRRTRAIVIYSMNALANSQIEELNKFLGADTTEEVPVTFALYTGQESSKQRSRIAAQPPDILLTNFMMLELIARDPLAIWTELMLGIELQELSKYRRAKPMTLSDAAKRLARDAGVDERSAKAALQSFLTAANDRQTANGATPFAFKLHQFIMAPRRPEREYRGNLEELPEHWLDLTKAKPKFKSADYRRAQPFEVTLDIRGNPGGDNRYWFIPGKFRFCVNCRDVTDAFGKETNRLAGLSGEGRSSATTMLTWYARRYGLSRDDLRYILDPQSVMGADYPSETFRVLKQNEIRNQGEYRTGRLVLDAWDTPEADHSLLESPC